MHTYDRTLSTSADSSNRANIMVDAARQFSINNSPDLKSIEQFKSMFYGMARDLTPAQLRFISSMLSRCSHLPAQVAYYLALQEFEVAAPLLLMSPVLKNQDLMKLEPKLTNEKLAVVARRSDIGVEIAHKMVARNSKLICRALDLNPVFRLNSIVEDADRSEIPKPTQQHSNSKTAKARDELIDIAKRAKSISARRKPENAPINKPVHVQLLEAIRTGEIEKSTDLLSKQSGLAAETLSRLINANRPEGIVVLLKGLRYSKAHTSQIMLKLSPWASRSVKYYNDAMQIYQNTPPSQCGEILTALGVNLTTPDIVHARTTQSNNQLVQVANERRTQFDRRKSATLFGNQKLAS